VGKVTTHSPKCGYYIMQSSVPSALFDSDANDMVISDITLSHNYNSVAIGPGIGTSETTINALEGFLKIANANSRPVILDADALNCIAARPTLLNYIPVLSILTPHEGEFDRLFGAQTSAEARLQRAVEVAKHHRILIILKGRYTAIVRPDGKIYFNSSGTPAMATPGSGDVLTGVLAGFLAQGFKPEVAALIAVYVHGIAGQLAEAKHGEYGVAADDIAANIGRAIKSIMD
jgi:NAD(P)H-hydrate epimerase